MTNAFTIPKDSSVLSRKGARYVFTSAVRARPRKVVPITLPGSSPYLPPGWQRKPK